MGFSSMRKLSVETETWPIDGEFVISRGARHEAQVVVATITQGDIRGRGECVPYARYGESVESVLDALLTMAGEISAGMDRQTLRRSMPAGAARNALDCALWDLEANLAGQSVSALAGFEDDATPLLSAYTISLGTPQAMARKAEASRAYSLLKLKLGGDGDIERMEAVRAAVPDARLVVDANEAWSEHQLEDYLAAANKTGVELVEQPLPAGSDRALSEISRPVPVCADESHHTSDDISSLTDRYDAINIKLDKAGGLTEALAAAAVAESAGLAIMVGCMVGTSLAMAPALLIARRAQWVDLDGPLLLARDRQPGLKFDGSMVSPAPVGLWGVPGRA